MIKMAHYSKAKGGAPKSFTAPFKASKIPLKKPSKVTSLKEGNEQASSSRRGSGDSPTPRRRNEVSSPYSALRDGSTSPRVYSTLNRIMDELASIKKEIGRLHEDHKALNHNIEVIREEARFNVVDSPYKNELTIKLAKAFCTSLLREVTEDKIKSIIRGTLPRELLQDKSVFASVLTYGKSKISTYKSEERRKVLGIKPYETYKLFKTSELAEKIVTTMKAPSDTLQQYTYNIMLLRKFIRTEPIEAKKEGQMYKNLKKWMEETYPEGEPSEEEWDEIAYEATQ